MHLMTKSPTTGVGAIIERRPDSDLTTIDNTVLAEMDSPTAATDSFRSPKAARICLESAPFSLLVFDSIETLSPSSLCRYVHQVHIGLLAVGKAMKSAAGLPVTYVGSKASIHSRITQPT